MQEVWRYVKLAAGNLLIRVISYSTDLVEPPDLIADCGITFAELVGRENVIAAPTAAASIGKSPGPSSALSATARQSRSRNSGVEVENRAGSKNEKGETRSKRLRLGFPLPAAMSK